MMDYFRLFLVWDVTRTCAFRPFTLRRDPLTLGISNHLTFATGCGNGGLFLTPHAELRQGFQDADDDCHAYHQEQDALDEDATGIGTGDEVLDEFVSNYEDDKTDGYSD